MPMAAQPFGARALHELEVVRVVHDAAGIGVFPVDPHRPDEFVHFAATQSLASNNGRLRLARSGILQAEVLIGLARGDAAARGAHQEALLDQVGLDHVFDRAALLAERRRKAFDADRTAVELLDDGRAAACGPARRSPADRPRADRAPRAATLSVDAAVGLAPRRSRARGAAGDWRCAACRASAARSRAAPSGIGGHAEDRRRARHDAARALPWS